MSQSILLIHGPGTSTTVPACVTSHCEAFGLTVEFCQSDDVDELCNIIQDKANSSCGLILNPYTPDDASVSSMQKYNSVIDGLENDELLIIELHMQNIMAMDNFEARPLSGPAGRMGMVCGLDENGYLLGINNIASKSGTS